MRGIAPIGQYWPDSALLAGGLLFSTVYGMIGYRPDWGCGEIGRRAGEFEMPYLPKLSRKLSKVYATPVRILGVYIWKANGRKIVDIHEGGVKKTCQLARV